MAKMAAYAPCMSVGGRAAPNRRGAAWLSIWGTGLRRVRTFELSVVIPTIALVVARLSFSDSRYITDESLLAGAAFWTVVIAIVEFLPIPIWRDLQVGPGFPLFTAAAFIHPAAVAAVIAFLGASDPRELRA
ncbi:MAG: hypothetical protein ACRD1T_08630, partial [Acidimicrobiia bacterium]